MAERRKILVTGATGRLARPVVRRLAETDEVWAMARFRDAEARAELEELGVVCVAKDLASDSFGDLPTDFTHVFHAGAIVFTGGSERDQARTFETNTQATGRLMHHCRGVQTFVHCSTGGVYAWSPTPVGEDDPLGVTIGNYSLSKIAAESVVQFVGRQFGVPTVVLRIGMVWGPEGGGPALRVERMLRGEPVAVSRVEPSWSSLIWEDDAVRLSIRALDLGAVPPVVVNLGGDSPVSTVEYCRYAGELLGIEPVFAVTDEAYPGSFLDPSRRRALLGPCEVDWREGMRRLIAHRWPEHVRPPA